jgi:hypothetical protein
VVEGDAVGAAVHAPLPVHAAPAHSYPASQPHSIVEHVASAA